MKRIVLDPLKFNSFLWGGLLGVFVFLVLPQLVAVGERIGGVTDHVGLSSTCSGECTCHPEGTCSSKHNCTCPAYLFKAELKRCSSGLVVEMEPDPLFPGCSECSYTNHAADISFHCYGENWMGCDQHLSHVGRVQVPLSTSGKTSFPPAGEIQDDWTAVAEAAQVAGHIWQFEVNNRTLVNKCAVECEHEDVDACLYGDI